MEVCGGQGAYNAISGGSLNLGIIKNVWFGGILFFGLFMYLCFFFNISVDLTSDTTDSINTLSSNTNEKNVIEQEVISSDDEWTLQNWPFDKVDEQLRDEIIDQGHRDVHPLAAYTADETLINPTNYQKELAGAMVVMSFRLKYALPWNSTSKKYEKLQCTTEIVQIRVVTKILPISRINMASKRAAPAKPKFGSPPKKMSNNVRLLTSGLV